MVVVTVLIFFNLIMFIIHKMLGLEWIPAFEIMKIHAVTLKIGYAFCNHSVSAEILCENRLLKSFRFPMCVLKTPCFLKCLFFLPPKQLQFSAAKERG